MQMRIITPQSHHQQATPRPPMVVSMAQPPPVSMQGLGNIAPMMGPAGGLPMMGSQPLMTDSGESSQQQQQQPYHHHHPHHHHTAPPPPQQNPHHPSAPPPRHPLPPHHPSSHNPGAGQYQHPTMGGSQNPMPPPPHSSNPNPPYQVSDKQTWDNYCVSICLPGPGNYNQNPARYQHHHLQPQQQPPPPPQQQQQQPYHSTMHEMQPPPHPYQQQQQQYNPVPTHSMQQPQPKSPQPMVAHHHHHPHHVPQHHQQQQHHHHHHHQPMQPQQQPPPQPPPLTQPRSHHMPSNSMVAHSSHQQPPQTMQPQPAPPPPPPPTHHMQHHHHPPHHHYQNTQPPPQPPPQPSHSMMHCSYPDSTLVQQPQPWLQPQQPSNMTCPPTNQDRGVNQVNQLNKIESIHFSTMNATVDSNRNIPSGPSNISSGPSNISSGPSNISSGPSNISSGPSNISSGPSNIPPGPSNIPSGPSNIPPGPSNIPSGPSNIPSGPSNIPSGPSNIPSGPSNIPSGPSNIPSGPSNISVPSNLPSGPSNVLHKNSSPSNATVNNLSSILAAPPIAIATATPPVVTKSLVKSTAVADNNTVNKANVAPTNTVTTTASVPTITTTVSSTSGSMSSTSSSCTTTTTASVASPITPTSAADEGGNSSTKEKTPMCLVNELARYNKIQHQYCLTDEKGPAHKKAFTVTLHLGTSEQYKASGPSIKKAQHSAAQRALLETQYKLPPPKPVKVVRQSKLTPTVELNALAMKRGEAAQYTFLETPPPLSHPVRMGPFGPPHLPPPLPHNVLPNLRALYHQKYFGRPMVVPVYLVSLKVGDREWVGEGGTAQQAKHNAADKALRVMKSLPIPQDPTIVSDTSTEDGNTDLKSPISCVHEVALRRSLTVQFEVVGESGPPHMRTFLTSCVVGTTKCQGEGASKKISKKRAAELMLDELRNLPPLPPTSPARMKRKIAPKKKCRNLVKEQTTPDYGQNINPISRLIQIQQSKKQREPVYTLIAEKGVPRRREFVMQVEVGDYTAQGTGPNKKLAKRAAAESVLQQMGFTKPAPQPAKSAIKSTDSEADKQEKIQRKVTFQEEDRPPPDAATASPRTSTRQIVPGLIVLSPPESRTDLQEQHNTAAVAKEIFRTNSHDTKAPSNLKPPAGEDTRRTEGKKQRPGDCKTTPSEAPAQPPDGGKGLSPPSVTNEAPAAHPPGASTPAPSAPSSTPQPAPPAPLVPGVSTTPGGVRPKDQLKYLAQILGLQIQFTDFPKGNKSEYLSLVSLNTSPPHVSHGHGATVESAHDQACKAALTTLAEMGLDDVASSD
ncbi:Double-stranded RNA-binding domain [Trinorchestia longiramus]|nr:Double-stranded RNA-binding domain [Trinorchestia longiramus]